MHRRYNLSAGDIKYQHTYKKIRGRLTRNSHSILRGSNPRRTRWLSRSPTSPIYAHLTQLESPFKQNIFSYTNPIFHWNKTFLITLGYLDTVGYLNTLGYPNKLGYLGLRVLRSPKPILIHCGSLPYLSTLGYLDTLAYPKTLGYPSTEKPYLKPHVLG